MLVARVELEVNALNSLGWSESLQRIWDGTEEHRERIPARVAAIERGAAWVWTEGGTTLASYGGLLAERPISEVLAVGDWVGLDHGARIRAVLPRRTALVRRAVGTSSAPQLVAANLDRVLVVTSVGEDFNPRRLERYLAAVHEGGATPVIVLNKADVPHDRDEMLTELEAIAPGVAVVFTSAIGATADVVRDLAEHLIPASTVALVGSSGVGKSTLLNALCAEERQDTGPVRVHDERGKHTTTKRELFVTPTGALVVDTPGMRELGLFDAAAGLSTTFEDVETLAAACRFTDCAHEGEPGCAILAALESGDLTTNRWASYQKLRAELAHEARRAGRRERLADKQQSKERSRSMRKRSRLQRKLGLKDW